MSKQIARTRRLKRLRAKLSKVGTMRVCVYRSSNNISAQLVDSSNGKVLATISTQQKVFKNQTGGNIQAAKLVGTEIAKKALELGHSEVTFDRSGYKFHGRVKALADGAREGGLKF